MKILTWNEKAGLYVLNLPKHAGFLVVERQPSGEYAWEYNAPSPRDDVRGRAATAQEGMEKAMKAAKRAGMVDA